MEALSKNGVPIPEMLGLCEDCDIIGTPFYLMKYVSGKIYKDPSLPGVDPESRQKIYSAMNRTIAKIHSVDVNKAGLSDYGKVINTIPILEGTSTSHPRWYGNCFCVYR